MTKRDFIDLADIPAADLRAILDDAHARKKARAGFPKGKLDPNPALDGEMMALIFEKPSTRTRISFDVGVRQLGGDSLMLSGSEIQLGRGESPQDTAEVLSRMVDIIMIRTFSHDMIRDLAAASSIPVINGLTDFSHPCQILADIQTIEEHAGAIENKRVAWTGDGNNVAISWVHAACKLGFELNLAVPEAFDMPKDVMDWAAAQNNGKVTLYRDPKEAVAGVDVVTTDTFVSMHDDTSDTSRIDTLMPYQVNDALMGLAQDKALFLHCLPAYRGKEVSASVMDGPQSVVFDEAENRLHVQKSIIAWCLNKL